MLFARKSKKSGKNLPEIGLTGLHFWPQKASNSPLQEDYKAQNSYLGIKVSPGQLYQNYPGDLRQDIGSDTNKLFSVFSEVGSKVGSNTGFSRNILKIQIFLQMHDNSLSCWFPLENHVVPL